MRSGRRAPDRPRHRGGALPLFGVPLLGAAIACGGAAKGTALRAPTATSKSAARSPFAVVKPARWFPVVSGAESRAFGQDPDGSVRLVERGLRLVEHPDGRIERAPDLLPGQGELDVVPLDGRLGGGFLYAEKDEGATRLYRSETWTSPLAPLVRLEFEATQVVAGFDRVHVESARTRAVVSVDPRTGEIRPDDTLPRAAAYGSMAFSDGWVGAVETDLRGVLVTFDAGASYHPLGVPTTVPGVLEQGGHVVVSTSRGNFALGANGELERTEGSESGAFGGLETAPPEDEVSADEFTPPERPGMLGGRPLEVAVLRGYPDGPSSAVVLANGTLARVSLEDGQILASSEHAVPEGATCTAVAFGPGIGFVCGEAHGRTRIYSFTPPLSLDPVMEFPEPRTVTANGRGAIVISGGCPGSEARPATYCVVGKTEREVRVQGDTGAERVTAFSDGSAVVLSPPRFGEGGAISIVSPEGKTESHPLSLAKVPTSIRELLSRGLWEDGLVEIEPGVLSVWVDSGTSFVGARVTRDGTVTAGTVRADAPRAALSGAVGAVTDDRGVGFETVDGGATWTEIALPVRTDVVAEAPPDRERGCSLVGCGLGSWLRVGWGKTDGKTDLFRAEEPVAQKAPPNWIVTWRWSCTATGETEGPEDVLRETAGKHTESRLTEPAPRGDVASELESSAWRTFLGARGPERAPGDLGFDLGTEDQPIALRGYAWGGRGAAWDRTGNWLVRGVDRFSVRKAVWSTAVSRTPWPDALSVAERFGSDPTHRVPADWLAVLDPDARGGVLRMRTPGATDLAVVEAGRAIVVARNADDLSVERPAGVVKALGKWFLGSTPGRTVQLLSVEGGALSLVQSYVRQTDDSFARIVRTVRGDGIGIWVLARGFQGTRSNGDAWFVHPVDPRTGELGEALIVPREALRSAPRPCEPDEDGWVLPYDEINPMTVHLQLENVSDPPALAHVDARLVAGPSGLCVDALAAIVDGPPPTALRATHPDARARRGSPLTVSDRTTDRRWGFRCAP